MTKRKIIGICAALCAGVIIYCAFTFYNKDSTKKTGAQTAGRQSTSAAYPFKLTSVSLKAITEYGVPTVIDFGSDGCIPCKRMAPVLEKLNAEWQKRAAVQFIDVWKYSEGVSDFPVQVIPTQFFFTAEGKPFVPSKTLVQKIEFIQYSDRSTNKHVFTLHMGGLTEEELRNIFSEMGID